MASVAAHEPTGGLADLLNGPRHTVPSRAPHSEEPFQHNQTLYVPSAQPYQPYQWPLPAHCVPYGGFPGLGYGMLMPSFLLPPCLEVPGYMLPHAQQHMFDYRRILSPHVAPNTAYQAYRFRFQNGMSRNRVMVSSEVQTEPLCRSSTQDLCNHVASSHTGSESGRGTGSGSPVSVSASLSENKSVACLEETSVLTQNRVIASNTINTTDLSAVHKSDILLQAERLQIKCSETPSRFKIVCTNTNAELANNNTSDLLQCSVGSIHSEDVVLCSYQSLEFRKDKHRVKAGTLKPSRRHCLSAYNKPAKIRMSPSGGIFREHPKPSRSRSSEMQIPRSSKLVMDKHDANFNVDCKILRLPFDRQYLKQTCQLEASIWSVESLVPYVPSSEWLLKNAVLTPRKSPVSDGQNQQDCESPKPHDQDLCNVQKSCLSYRPSTSWLADFGNVYYYSKLPVLQQKCSRFCTSPEKQLHKMLFVSHTKEGKQAVSPEFSSPAHEKKMRSQGQAIRTEICDQKCCSFHSCKCTTKSSPRPAGSGMRCGWRSHLSLVDEVPRHSCKNDSRRKPHRTLCLPDSLCRKRDDSEMKVFDAKKAAKDRVGAHDTQKILLESQMVKCHQAKLEYQAGLFKDCKYLHRASPAQKKSDEHGLDGVLSCRWRNTQRSQKEKCWDGGMQESDTFENGGKIQNKERTECVHMSGLSGTTQGEKCCVQVASVHTL